MITGAVRNKVDKIWTDIWAGGITNPLTVIEQLTYLMFIRQLDVEELRREQRESFGLKVEKIFPQSVIGQSMRWSRFKDMEAGDIFRIMSVFVFPAIKNMKHGKLPDFNSVTHQMVKIEDEPQKSNIGETAFSTYMQDAMFQIPTPQLLEKIITGMEDLYSHDLDGLDMQGDVYEYMLGKLATSGQNGQFRTPKHIRDMMVELVVPTPKDRICEQRCLGLIQYWERCA